MKNYEIEIKKANEGIEKSKAEQEDIYLLLDEV